MPPAAVGAAFVSVGLATSAATVAAITTAVYVGAAVGALTSAAVALVTGGDVLESAVKGAVVGGVSGGVLKGFSGVASGVGDAGVAATEVGEAGIASINPSTAGIMAPGQVAEATAPAAAGNAGAITSNVVEKTGEQAGGGILSKAASWMNANPEMSSVVGQGLSGAAKGLLDAKTTERELESAMERDKLYIDSKKVKGLSGMDLKVALPTIGEFTATPKWQMPSGGLLQEAQNAA